MAEENNSGSAPEPCQRPAPVYQPEHVETREAPPTRETRWNPVPERK